MKRTALSNQCTLLCRSCDYDVITTPDWVNAQIWRSNGVLGRVQFNAFDPYCTVMMRPVHVATPKLDGRKTECIHCYNKTAFGKESCEEHKSDWISNTQTPKWNKRIVTVLDAGAAEAVIAIYSSGSRGKAHDLIGWYERIFVRARQSVSCVLQTSSRDAHRRFAARGRRL